MNIDNAGLLERVDRMATKTRSYAYWCAECRKWQWCGPDGHGGYYCTVCGETIYCDECGKEWTEDHACKVLS